jgi:hypothetical protein
VVAQPRADNNEVAHDEHNVKIQVSHGDDTTASPLFARV